MTQVKVPETSARVNELIGEVFMGKPANPAPLYDELRETGDGVHFFAPANAWFAFRFEDVARIGREDDIFSSDFFDQAPMGIHDPTDPEHVRFIDFSRRLMAFTDPPRHTALRNVVRKAFVPRAVARWRPFVENAVDELLNQFNQGDLVEFVEQLSIDVPVEAICAVLGVEDVDRPMIRAGSAGLASTFDPTILGEARDTAIRDALRLVDNIDSVIDARRKQPREDLISLVLETQAEDGNDLDAADLLSQMVFLLAAGNETTVNMLSGGVHHLLEFPDQRRLLQSDMSLVNAFVNESLRLDTPIDMPPPRLTRKSTVMGETHIPEGVYIFQVVGSANRDPRKFEDPYELQIERSPNSHATFNQGLHSCVGAPLARLEGEIFFTRFLERFPDFTAGDGPARLRAGHVQVRGFEALPIRL